MSTKPWANCYKMALQWQQKREINKSWAENNNFSDSGLLWHIPNNAARGYWEMCLNGIRAVCVYYCLCLSVCERERGKCIFVFMQIHLVRSLGIMWKLKMEKRNVTGAQWWMNTLHGKYPHVQTQVHVTHTQYLNIYTQAFKYTSCCVIISCYLCVRNVVFVLKISIKIENTI